MLNFSLIFYKFFEIFSGVRGAPTPGTPHAATTLTSPPLVDLISPRKNPAVALENYAFLESFLRKFFKIFQNFFEIFFEIFWIFFEYFLKIFWKSVSPPPEKNPGYAHGTTRTLQWKCYLSYDYMLLEGRYSSFPRPIRWQNHVQLAYLLRQNN